MLTYKEMAIAYYRSNCSAVVSKAFCDLWAANVIPNGEYSKFIQNTVFWDYDAKRDVVYDIACADLNVIKPVVINWEIVFVTETVIFETED